MYILYEVGVLLYNRREQGLTTDLLLYEITTKCVESEFGAAEALAAAASLKLAQANNAHR